MSLYNKIAGQKVERIEALSDGVFAIAMTIMVFDLKDPVSAAVNSEEKLIPYMKSILPQLLTYFLSFMTLGIFWTGQSTQFGHIRGYNRQLSWISLFFLLFVSLIPFTTSVLSHHISNTLSVLFYWCNILMLGLLLLLHWKLADRHGFIVFENDAEEKLIRKAVITRILIGQLLYLAGAAISFFQTYASIGFLIVVQLNYALGLSTAIHKKWVRRVHPEEAGKLEENESDEG